MITGSCRPTADPEAEEIAGRNRGIFVPVDCDVGCCVVLCCGRV